MDKHVKEQLLKIEIPADIHERSKVGVKKAKSEMEGKWKRFTKKRLATAVISACLIIPTGAFAYEKLLADELYGSFEHLKKHALKITMESYLLFNTKLTQAKGDLGKDEFEQFKKLLHVFTNAMLDYGNQHGNIDYATVPAQQREEIKAALHEIQPFFDRLNGLPSSKELLTVEEYEQYIEALMTYEMTMARLGVTSVPDVTSMPMELQEEFIQAQQYLDYVNEKQISNRIMGQH